MKERWEKRRNGSVVEISALISGMEKRLFLRWALMGILAVIGGSFLLFSPGRQEALAADQAAAITYPVKTFQDGNARFYEYKTKDGITIKYFILKSQDGVIRAAFDACDVCWAEGKGYYQKGDFMVCRNCGRRFASNRVNDVSGGCNPAPLNREVVGDKLVIKVPDILTGKKYFDFAQRGQR
ncbi:MAG: DUF2318 domain-containing protein [Thermodesulfobacteriota bacterium]|nr:DUF2318 domain-containing protein [Thermodesulfobacteriota bacterium]